MVTPGTLAVVFVARVLAGVAVMAPLAAV